MEERIISPEEFNLIYDEINALAKKLSALGIPKAHIGTCFATTGIVIAKANDVNLDFITKAQMMLADVQNSTKQ